MPQSNDSNFQYDPLPNSKIFIRLLEIQQLGESEVVCHLSTWPMEQLPTYHAVSYTWGDSAYTSLIRVNGKLMEIRQNCAATFRRRAIKCGLWAKYIEAQLSFWHATLGKFPGAFGDETLYQDILAAREMDSKHAILNYAQSSRSPICFCAAVLFSTPLDSTPNCTPQSLHTLEETSETFNGSFLNLNCISPSRKGLDIRNQLLLWAKIGGTNLQPLDLEDTLLWVQGLQCQDPRDRIYGALFFINWEGLNPIIPDYKKSTFELAVTMLMKRDQLNTIGLRYHERKEWGRCSAVEMAKRVVKALCLTAETEEVKFARNSQHAPRDLRRVKNHSWFG
ncbi:hypothetical protein AAE478_006878 [Parahypoxylon ruwenzoriense]